MCWKEVVRQREIFLEVVTFCFLKLVPFGEDGAVIRIAGQHRRGSLGPRSRIRIFNVSSPSDPHLLSQCSEH